MTPNARTTLLLTAPLQIGRQAGDADLLSLAEYNELARFLHKQGWQPSDLLEGKAAECEEGERLQELLDRGFLLGQALDLWQSLSIRVLTRADDEYPKRIKIRLKDAAPPVLYLCGNAELLDRGGLAVLGDDPSQSVGESHVLGTSLQSSMLAVLEAGGSAVAVLADGLAKAALIRELRVPLREKRVALISASDPNGRSLSPNSQLIYALADRALVLGLKPPDVRAGALKQLELGWLPLHAATGARALRDKGALAWPS